MKVKFVNSSLAFATKGESEKLLSTYTKISAKLTNATSKPEAIKRLLSDLEIDSTSGIWSKLKALYIPCLANTTDAGNVFYDAKADLVATESMSYTIVKNRGVAPTTPGSSSKLSVRDIENITFSNLSAFMIIAQRPDTTLGSSAANVASFGSLIAYWEKASTRINRSNPTFAVSMSPSSEWANKPELIVMSAEYNNKRYVCSSNDAKEVTAPEAPSATQLTYQMSGGYSIMSMFAIADGLTKDETILIKSALTRFIENFGVESSNA